MDMINLNDAVSLLRAKREELVRLLEAVDKALAALDGVDATVAAAPEGNPLETTEQTASAAVPTRLKPRRVLSDEHKHALNEGRRRARMSKAAAAGLARELPDQSTGLSASNADAPPRLVKRTSR